MPSLQIGLAALPHCRTRIAGVKPAMPNRHLALMPKLRAATAESEKAVLQNAVTATDQQIDALVYDLYGLTEDEIKLVES